MTEEFLSFIWQNKLFTPSLKIDGEQVSVISTGDLNRDSGPDFFNTKIKVGSTIWAGNAEVHVRSSDWSRHGHQANPAFDNVILHITLINDETVYTSKGRVVPTIVLDFDPQLFDNYKALLSNQWWIPCADKISGSKPVVITSFLSRLGIERMEGHSIRINENLRKTANDWEEVLYRQLAGSYGFHINSQPFGSLAESLPYSILKKYSDNLQSIETFLFGQAGFLHDDYSSSTYYNTLKKEYRFFQSKYSLQPIDTHLWKFMRLRPRNFPVIRIAQFASLIHRHPLLVSAVLEAEKLTHLTELFNSDVSDYWENHFSFSDTPSFVKKSIGSDSVNIIIINTVVPFLFSYGKKMGFRSLQVRALDFLEEIKAENNSIVRQWTKLNLVPANAFESQALLELKNNYCERKRCLECNIGVKIISRG